MKKIHTLSFALLLALGSHAQTVSTGGLTYTLNDETLTATLTTFDEAPTDSILTIPETVTDETGTKTYTVTAIGDKVFYGSTFNTAYRTKMLGVKKIIVPKTVETIGQQAFWITTGKESQYGGYTCSLDSLVFAEGSQLREIGEQAFNLSEVDLPEGLTAIGRRVFYNCSRLVRIGIPSTVDSIAPQAFNGTSYLKEVTLPEGLRVVGDSAFMDMGRAYSYSETPTMTIPANVETIGAWAFNRISYVKVTGSVPPTIQPNTFKSGVTVEAPLDILDIYAQADVWKDLNVTGGSFATDDGRSYSIISSTTVRLDQFGNDLIPQLTIPDEVETVEHDGHTFTIDTYNFSTSRIVELNVERQYKSLPAEWVFNSALKTLRLPSSIEMIDSLGTTFKDVGPIELFLTSPLPPKLCGWGSYLSISALWLDEAYIPAYADSDWRMWKLNPFSENGFGYCRLFTVDPQVAITSTTGSSLTITDGMTVTHEGREFAVKHLWDISDDLKELIVTTNEVSVSYDVLTIGHPYLERLEMADGMTEIPSSCFLDSNLKYIKLPSTIQTIGQQAFQHTSKLRHLELPEGLKTISFAAFLATGLEEINLPASVDSIEGRAFSGFNLQRINVAEGNQKYCDVDGVLYSKDKKTLIAWPTAKPQTHYDIPEGTEFIAGLAFNSPTTLRSLRLPDSFQGVKQLAPRNETVIYSFLTTEQGILAIHVNGLSANLDAFNGYASQRILYLPAIYTPYLYKPGEYAEPEQGWYPDEAFILDQDEFQNCMEFIKEETGEEDFYAALDLYKNNIWESIDALKQKYTVRTEEILDARVFEYSFNFKNENYQNPMGATVRAYTAPGRKTSVTIPAELVFSPASYNAWVPNGWNTTGMTQEQREKYFDDSEWPGTWHIPVTAIGDGVFANDDKLETVILPDSMQYIGHAAFFGCKNLKEVRGLDKMDEAYLLADGTIRKTYLGIGNFAFADCPQLPTVALGGFRANSSMVAGSTGLKTIALSDTLLTQVNSVGCPTYVVDDGVAYFNSVIPTRVTDEEGTVSMVYANLPMLAIYPAGREATEFIVPDSIQEISILSMAYSQVEKLTLPASVAYIEDAALYGNNTLKELVLLADSVPGLPYFTTSEDYNKYNGGYIGYTDYHDYYGKPYYYTGSHDGYHHSRLYGESGPIATESYPAFDRDYTSQNTIVLMKQSVIDEGEQTGDSLYELYKQWFKEVRAIEDEVVGIEAITATSTSTSCDSWYTLDGRRITRPTARGIYVHGGKKIVVK